MSGFRGWGALHNGLVHSLNASSVLHACTHCTAPQAQLQRAPCALQPAQPANLPTWTLKRMGMSRSKYSSCPSMRHTHTCAGQRQRVALFNPLRDALAWPSSQPSPALPRPTLAASPLQQLAPRIAVRNAPAPEPAPGTLPHLFILFIKGALRQEDVRYEHVLKEPQAHMHPRSAGAAGLRTGWAGRGGGGWLGGTTQGCKGGGAQVYATDPQPAGHALPSTAAAAALRSQIRSTYTLLAPAAAALRPPPRLPPCSPPPGPRSSTPARSLLTCQCGLCALSPHSSTPAHWLAHLSMRAMRPTMSSPLKGQNTTTRNLTR